MIKRLDGINNIEYKQNLNSKHKNIYSTDIDRFERSEKQDSVSHNPIVSKLKALFAAMAIGLATQSCSDDTPVDEVNNSQSGLVLDFGDALDKLRDDSYKLTVPEIIEKLDSTVYANRNKIEDYASKSDENYQITTDFIKTVLSAFGSENDDYSELSKEFKSLADENDGLLNADYVNRINDLYKNIDNINSENPGYYDSNGYLTDIYNKQNDLKTNCIGANTVRQNAIKKLMLDAQDMNEKEPIVTDKDYTEVYDKYMLQTSELLDMESLNSIEADEKINELLNTYNELNKVAQSKGKDRIYDAGLKMLDASHTMVDAACEVLVRAMEKAATNVTPDFSETFRMIHYNLDKIMNTGDYDSPAVDEIIDGLEL